MFGRNKKKRENTSIAKKKKKRNKDEQGFIQNVRHFILKILCGNQRIEKILSVFPLQSYNLSTSTSNVWFENGTESVEEPSMGIDLFLIFFFFLETKDDLNLDALFGSFDFQVGIDGDLLKGC